MASTSSVNFLLDPPNTGHQVPMSQKGPAADPVSHSPVTSLASYEEVSPGTRPAKFGHQTVLQTQEVSTGNGHTLGPNNQGERLGISSILNPAEACANTREGRHRQHWQQSGHVARSRTLVSTMPKPQGQLPISGRNSPAIGYPFAPTNERRPPSPESSQGNTHPETELRRLQLQSGTAGGGPAWPDMIPRPGLGGPMLKSDGQQAFMTLPGSEIPIPVQVDYSQASKKADEKRLRNAKASTRHRRKKKDMQEENIRMLQDLKDEQGGMAQQISALTRQRDFYREERNRLRDIVLHTPAISQHASGPPSPILARSVTSYADHSPAAGQPQPLTTPAQGYLSDALSVERPSQWRRTCDHTEYAANYSTQPGSPPTTPPPMQSHDPGMPPRPMSAHPTTHQERLPSLRAIDGAAQPSHEIHTRHSTHERDQVTVDWRLSHPKPYETD